MSIKSLARLLSGKLHKCGRTARSCLTWLSASPLSRHWAWHSLGVLCKIQNCFAIFSCKLILLQLCVPGRQTQTNRQTDSQMATFWTPSDGQFAFSGRSTKLAGLSGTQSRDSSAQKAWSNSANCWIFERAFLLTPNSKSVGWLPNLIPHPTQTLIVSTVVVVGQLRELQSRFRLEFIDTSDECQSTNDAIDARTTWVVFELVPSHLLHFLQTKTPSMIIIHFYLRAESRCTKQTRWIVGNALVLPEVLVKLDSRRRKANRWPLDTRNSSLATAEQDQQPTMHFSSLWRSNYGWPEADRRGWKERMKERKKEESEESIQQKTAQSNKTNNRQSSGSRTANGNAQIWT